ncbi:MAG: helix-turn-helix transcriptional regulator [Firmicutes bacterium]|nr:helix-turn-helix transcriptional regulator [Bacillota bacterium]
MTLGERIKYLRNKMGLTQEELAKFLSCPRGTINNWEIDRSEPDSKMLGKIANFFDVSLDYLITGKNFNAKPGIMDDLTDEEKNT